MNIGDRIKIIREEKGLTQQDLAEHSGVCQQMISKLETGKASATSDIVKLAYALDVSAAWLEGLSKTRSAEPSKASRKKTDKKQSSQGETLNHKALQVCIEYLTKDPPKLFERSGFRKQAEIFSKCYELCTQPKNKSLNKDKLMSTLSRRARRF